MSALMNLPKISSSVLKNFAERVKRLQEEGRDIISLGIGEPYSSLSEEVKIAGTRAILEDRTGYVPVIGSWDIRKLIASKYAVSTSEVFVTHGAKTALGAIMQCLINSGDQVLIPMPYYPSHVGIAEFLGAEVLFIDTRKNDFRLTAGMVKARILEGEFNPKVLVINSPNNPTGVEYDRDELEKIAGLSREFGFTIISDECYSNFSSNRKFTMFQFSGNIIVVNSVSKTYAMPGIRIGWGVCAPGIVHEVEKFLGDSVGCPGSVSERIAFQALQEEGIPDFSRQREAIFSWLDMVEISHVKGEGALYVFPEFSKFMEKRGISDSVKLAGYFLEKTGVALAPGEAFGEDFRRHLRIMYSTEERKLRIALERLGKFF